MSLVFLVLMLGQSVQVSPPPGPAWGRADQISDVYRRQCMSEAGILIATKDWLDDQEAAKAREPERDKIDRELGEAAYTAPIDINRLDRAAQARDNYQAARLDELRRRNIATMRKLPPKDRTIFARGFSIYRPERPAQTCPATIR